MHFLGLNGVTDQGLKYLATLPKLENLMLRNMKGIIGRNLKNFRYLKKLHCSTCENLKRRDLYYFITHCNSLEKIELKSHRLLKYVDLNLVKFVLKTVKSRIDGIPLILQVYGFPVRISRNPSTSEPGPSKLLLEIANEELGLQMSKEFNPLYSTFDEAEFIVQVENYFKIVKTRY